MSEEIKNAAENAATENPQVRHEGRDIKVRSVVIVALVFAGIMVVVHFALVGLWGVLAEREAQTHAARETPSGATREVRVLPSPPEPRLQAASAEDAASLRRRQEKRLNSYGWINRKTGAVHIPIERAMELSAKP